MCPAIVQPSGSALLCQPRPADQPALQHPWSGYTGLHRLAARTRASPMGRDPARAEPAGHRHQRAQRGHALPPFSGAVGGRRSENLAPSGGHRGEAWGADLGGTSVAAVPLEHASAEQLCAWLEPYQKLPSAVLNTLSVGEEAVIAALEQCWPTAPHQRCQAHFLNKRVEPVTASLCRALHTIERPTLGSETFRP